MKGLKIGLIIMLSVIVLLLTGILLAGISGAWGWQRENFDPGGVNFSSELYKTTEIQWADMTELLVDYRGTGYDVTILPSQDDTMILEEYFSFEPKEDQLAVIDSSDNRVIIRGQSRTRNFGFFGVTLNTIGFIKLYLPVDAWQGLKGLVVDNTSGDIRFQYEREQLTEYMALDRISLGTTSGSIIIPYVNTVEGELSASSGSINLEQGVGNLTFNCTSGKIQAGDLRGDAEFNATSGNIRVEELEGSGSFNTTSGSIRVGALKGNSIFNASSGNLEAGLLEGDTEFASTSGKISVEGLVGNGRFEASSGNITVYGLEGSGSFRTTSGSIYISVDSLKGDMDLRGSSGNATLLLPENSSFHFRGQCSSGRITAYCEEELSVNAGRDEAGGTVGSNPVGTISCKFTSGNIRLEKKEAESVQ